MPNKRTLISVFILCMLCMPVSKGIAGLDNGAWPMRGHDSRHTSQSQYIESAFGELKWQYKMGATNSYVRYSAPAIGADGTVYVGSYIGDVNAINPDGTLKWSYRTGAQIISSPAVGADGTIYVGSYDDYLYAINPDGTLKWRYQTGDSIESSPVIGVDGTIYVGSFDRYLYAINPDGTLKWRYYTWSEFYSSPAIGPNGTVYIGSINLGFYAISPNGTHLSSRTLSPPLSATR